MDGVTDFGLFSTTGFDGTDGFAVAGTTVDRFAVDGNGGALALVVAVDGFDVDGFEVDTVVFAGADEEGRDDAADSFTRSESAT